MTDSSMLRLSTVIVIILLLAAPTSSVANDRLSIDVIYENNLYSTELSTTINAPADSIFKQLTSYDKLNTFSQFIQQSQLLAKWAFTTSVEGLFYFHLFRQTINVEANHI
ncbi:MAG TPA: hypothetical protein EYG47_01420 [Cycloclasticus sp.]|nr:hypothetical protein [Cycloclasticus sp.]